MHHSPFSSLPHLAMAGAEPLVTDHDQRSGSGRGRRRMAAAMFMRDRAFGGPGFRGAPGFGCGPGFGGGPRGRGRRRRGDIRTAVLQLLRSGPKHGYQLMQEIAERSGGHWTPSPGSIYPTISQLEDEGLVSVSTEDGRKTITLTDAGRALAEGYEGPDPWTPHSDESGIGKLAESGFALAAALKQVGMTGRRDQIDRARALVDHARRELYLMLAEDAPPAAPTAAPPANDD
ncbi:MAG: PadR family transcriptional regulator [Acidimicrobiia bacterium]